MHFPSGYFNRLALLSSKVCSSSLSSAYPARFGLLLPWLGGQ